MTKSVFFIVTLILSIALVGCNELNQQNTPASNQETNGSWENVVIESDNKTEPVLPTVVREICPYECCVGNEYKNKLCDADEYCNDNNNCKKYGCIEDSGCNSNEYCADYACLSLTCGSCEYADNHQCLQYQCCENADCSEGECVNHVCEVLYKVEWAPDSIEQNLLDQQLKAMRNALRKNGYGPAGSGYCLINNSTHDNLNNCDTALSSLSVNEGQVYHLVSARVYNITGNYDFKIINAFLISYSKVYADYYSLVDGESYYDKVDENLYTVKIKGMFSTVAREDLEEFVYGEITREEFLDRIIVKETKES